jgi:hypothetical protein
MPDVRDGLQQHLVGRAHLPAVQGDGCLAHGRAFAAADGRHEMKLNRVPTDSAFDHRELPSSPATPARELNTGHGKE